MFDSLAADVVFFGTLSLIWLAVFTAKDPPGMVPASRFAVTAGRVVSATLLTLVLGLLPALVAAALVGGSLA